ncbi:MAG: ethanolamine utilization microcompartment protein EutL [Rhodoferax sp.]|nr:ethanolamine utilization microcompartment protein EutL [Rhodoferax sp.]MDP3654859.1 ethanolamine utilization microcompartment protein EutL [Rhodoferax sp.]
MAALERIAARVCAARLIAAVQPDFKAELGLDDADFSLGLFSADSDDVAYIAADEATKQAQVRVVFGSSLYAGAAHGPSSTAGEVLLMLAGPSPAEVRAGLDAALAQVGQGAAFQWANAEHTVAFLAHLVSRCGSYLAGVAGVREGDALAYLVAPPLEAAVGIDAALKAAEVRLAGYVRPPSPTNYSGAYLQGSQAACAAACAAFAAAVCDIASHPLRY